MRPPRPRRPSSPRRWGRTAALLLLLAPALVAAGCGGAGRGAETDPEKGSDVEILNRALARELAGIELYALPAGSVPRREARIARRLRAHAQEYASAITKAIRGAGGESEAEPLEPEPEARRPLTELLLSAYEHESAALSDYIEAAPRLYTDAPRTLAAALAAGHAQHLVVLRRALGATLVESIPDAFDVGEVEPPVVGGDGSGR